MSEQVRWIKAKFSIKGLYTWEKDKYRSTCSFAKSPKHRFPCQECWRKFHLLKPLKSDDPKRISGGEMLVVKLLKKGDAE